MFSYTINSSTVSFSNSTLTDPGTFIVGYLWDFGDGATSTDVNPIHTYLTPNINHPVKLTITAFRGDKCCTEEIIIFVSQATKQNDKPEPTNNLKVVPNPNNGEFLLVSKANLESDIEYHIVAFETGKVVLTGMIKSKSKDPINLGHVPPGIYIVIYNIEGIWEGEKFIVE
jgi:PKD repeat protein